MKNNKREKVWSELYVFGEEQRDAAVRKIAQDLGISEIFAVLLYNRGYKNAEDARRFLQFEEADLHDPYLLADMQKAVERIFSAIDGHERSVFTETMTLTELRLQVRCICI